MRDDVKDKCLLVWLQEHGEALSLKIMISTDEALQNTPKASFAAMAVANLSLIFLVEKVLDSVKYGTSNPLLSLPVIETAMSGVEEIMEKLECNREEFVQLIKKANGKIKEMDPQAVEIAESCVFDEESAICVLIPLFQVYRNGSDDFSINTFEKTGRAAVSAFPAYFVRDLGGNQSVPSYVPAHMREEYIKMRDKVKDMDIITLLSTMFSLRHL